MQQPKKPKAKVYSFKSQGVIELLKKLLEKFETDKLETTKAETNAINAYNMAKQAREEALAAFEKSKKEKEEIKGEAEKALTTAQDDLASTKEDLAANEKSLEDVTKECETEADEFASRSEARSGEILAIEMAIKILAKVGGVRAPELVQSGALQEFLQSGGASFIQIDDPKAQAVKVLIAEATKLHSKSLRRLAQQITAHLSGPFDKINQMIQKMIFRLMAEQKDEDDHKAWCDLEVGKTEDAKADKIEKLDKLNLKIENAESEIAALTEKITENDAALTEVVAYIQEETQIRAENKAENEAAIADAQLAQKAIEDAKKVLSDFYKESGQVAKEPWEGGDVLGDPKIPGAKFIQMRKMMRDQRKGVELPDQPETWDAGYTGVADPEEEGTGVIAILNKILEDFASMEAESVAQEETDQKNFDADMTEQAVEKGRLEQDTKMATARKEALTQKLDTLSNE